MQTFIAAADVLPNYTLKIVKKKLYLQHNVPKLYNLGQMFFNKQTGTELIKCNWNKTRSSY